MEPESRQQRRHRERQMGSIKGSTTPHPSGSNQRETILRSWPVALGVPGVTYGAGLAVLTLQFALGCIIAAGAAAWLLVFCR